MMLIGIAAIGFLLVVIFGAEGMPTAFKVAGKVVFSCFVGLLVIVGIFYVVNTPSKTAPAAPTPTVYHAPAIKCSKLVAARDAATPEARKAIIDLELACDP